MNGWMDIWMDGWLVNGWMFVCIYVCMYICMYVCMCVSVSLSSFQPVNNWMNKGCGMCYPVCVMLHTKDPWLLIEKNSPCSGGSMFPLAMIIYHKPVTI